MSNAKFITILMWILLIVFFLFSVLTGLGSAEDYTRLLRYALANSSISVVFAYRLLKRSNLFGKVVLVGFIFISLLIFVQAVYRMTGNTIIL